MALTQPPLRADEPQAADTGGFFYTPRLPEDEWIIRMPKEANGQPKFRIVMEGDVDEDAEKKAPADRPTVLVPADLSELLQPADLN